VVVYDNERRRVVKGVPRNEGWAMRGWQKRRVPRLPLNKLVVRWIIFSGAYFSVSSFQRAHEEI